MAKIAKSVVDSALRNAIFEDLMNYESSASDLEYRKINDRQYGTIIVDANGAKRYCRIGVIVAEEREDMTAEELMEKEIADYNEKQAKKAEKAEARAKKAEADKARREAKENKGE